MKKLSTVGLLIFLLSFTASVGNAQPQAVINCFEERTFQYTSGKYKNAEIKYRLHTPETIRYGQKYPLIVHLHGVGEAGTNNTRSLLYLDAALPLMTGPKKQDFFMLVTQCPGDNERHWFFRPSTKDGTLDVLVAIMEHVIAENPIDEKRITATGVSSGGYGVWELLMRYPDMFAGAVPTACGAPMQLGKLAALKQTPVWSIVNKGDRQIDFDSLRIAKQAVNGAGGSMAVTETSASGHNAWSPAMKEYNCFQWMLAQKRGSWFAPAPGVIVREQSSALLPIVMYILPVAIAIFLLWGTLCEWVAIAWQSVWERLGNG